MKPSYYTLDDFYLKTNILLADLKKIESIVRVLHLGNFATNEEGGTEIVYKIHIITSGELTIEEQFFLKKLKANGSPIIYVGSFDV